MSLYDGLGIGEKDVGGNDGKADLSGWKKNSSMQLLQNQLQTRKPPSRRALKTAASLAPVVDLKRSGGEIRFNPLTGKAELATPTPVSAAPVGLSGQSGGFLEAALNPSYLGVVDEYNPLRPNEYDDFSRRQREQRMREKEERRAKEEGERRRDDRSPHRRRRRHSSDSDANSGDEEEEKRRRMSHMNKAAIAPPQALIEQDKQEDTMPERPVNKPKFGNVSTVAANIMAKMGYRQGSGLGAKEQGMSRALEVEKTSRRGGRILHEKDIAKIPDPMLAGSGSPGPAGAPTQNADLLKNPTKVVLLRNMVGPGEVDAELQPETAEECSKYGKVVNCVIYELQEVSAEEAVRIFIEFEKIDSAIKALIDLNGRFFGGRTVRANFYDQDLYEQLKLGSDPL